MRFFFAIFVVKAFLVVFGILWYLCGGWNLECCGQYAHGTMQQDMVLQPLPLPRAGRGPFERCKITSCTENRVKAA